MIKAVDIIFGLAWGDEGKGKISNAIAKNYNMICRWNGGPNAGHTVYINNKKYKTHIIPCGIFQNKPSIIGPNCIINIDKFYDMQHKYYQLSSQTTLQTLRISTES